MQVKKVFVCGDTHGYNDIAKISKSNWNKHEELTKDDVLIILGDFGGIWYPRSTSSSQERYLEMIAGKPWTTAVVLGNHENYDEIFSLPTEIMWGEEVYVYTHHLGGKIYFFKRGKIYNINNLNILTIGGALSIDKEMRREGTSWWPQEDLSYTEINSCIDLLNTEHDHTTTPIDIVLTHTCPQDIIKHILPTRALRYGIIRDPVSAFLTEVREILHKKGYSDLEWHFGHFHEDTKFLDDDGDNFICHYQNEPFEITKPNQDA